MCTDGPAEPPDSGSNEQRDDHYQTEPVYMSIEKEV